MFNVPKRKRKIGHPCQEEKRDDSAMSGHIIAQGFIHNVATLAHDKNTFRPVPILISGLGLPIF